MSRINWKLQRRLHDFGSSYTLFMSCFIALRDTPVALLEVHRSKCECITCLKVCISWWWLLPVGVTVLTHPAYIVSVRSSQHSFSPHSPDIFEHSTASHICLITIPSSHKSLGSLWGFSMIVITFLKSYYNSSWYTEGCFGSCLERGNIYIFWNKPGIVASGQILTLNANISGICLNSRTRKQIHWYRFDGSLIIMNPWGKPSSPSWWMAA